MPKPPIATDERTAAIIRKICTRLYLATMCLFTGAIFYRSFFLKQEISDYEDIAAIMTINVILLTVSLIYYGGTRLNLKKASIPRVLVFYLLFVTTGTVVTAVKYKTWEAPFILEKLIIIASICAIFVAGWLTVAYLGNRKVDREIDDGDE